jgi:hypothetical protein
MAFEITPRCDRYSYVLTVYREMKSQNVTVMALSSTALLAFLEGFDDQSLEHQT